MMLLPILLAIHAVKDDRELVARMQRRDPQALAEAILCALSDPPRLERMASAAQRYVLGTHSWDRVAERILFS